MPLSTIEQLAQTLHYYNVVIEEQTVKWRAFPSLFRAACKRVQESSFKPGRNWLPAADDYNAYMEYMDNICKMNPQTPDDVKIVYAAHAASMCFMSFVFGKHPTEIQDEVIKRLRVLTVMYSQQRSLRHKAYPDDPLSLIGKHFLLAEDKRRYKVTGVSVTEDATVYQLRFGDSLDTVECEAEQFEAMFAESIYDE